MKTLNFTCEEVLSSLKDKSKTQTIRKAWKKHKNCRCPEGIHKKPPKFNAGDKVKLFWDDNEELGEVEIIEVFKVQIDKVSVFIEREGYIHPATLSEPDGFQSPTHMFKYLDYNYDLRKPKDFWVYRWEWI